MKTKRKFLRVETQYFSRIGKGRKKIQTWRRPRGKQNKIRLNRFSYPVQPGIGFGTPRSESGKVKGLYPMLITTQSDVEKLTKENIAIISRKIGAKKKIQIIKQITDKGFKIQNVGGKK